MGQNKKSNVVVFFIILVMVGASSISVSSSKDLWSIDEKGGKMIDGQILFPPLYGTTTYLIDNTGIINHTWTSSYTPGAAVYWLGNGTILRTIRVGASGQGGAGGGVQKVTVDEKQRLGKSDVNRAGNARTRRPPAHSPVLRPVRKVTAARRGRPLPRR